MLKFLRKYNLIIMVIGGSLLMVVFLLQPILTRLAPDPGKRKAATLGDTIITRNDLSDASNDIAILNRFLPFIVFNLNLDPEHKDDHYLLLLHEAKSSGLVGEAGDGASWIPELAAEQARIQAAQQLMQQGIPRQFIDQFLNSPAQIQQIAQQAIALQPELLAHRERTAAGLGAPVERLDQALANARGIARLRARYTRAIRLSDRVAISEASKNMNSAVADIITLGADLFEDDIPEPTEAQLQAHFEQFADEIPGSGDMGFGYRQPPSVKLAWLTLDPAVLADAIELDPVEVRKRYAQDRDRYPGEFADERAAIEAQMRAQRVENLMVEADAIIRRMVLAATRRLEEDDQGYKILPDNWNEQRPRLTQLATAISDELARSAGVNIPLPEVQVRNADWLSAQDLSQLMPLGRAGIRVGSTTIPVYNLPNIVRENETGIESPLRAQVGVTLVNAPALDAAGRRYYITILDARPESPPDSLDDVREQVTADVREKLAYERLLELQEPLIELARAEGLKAIEDRFSTVSDEPELDENADPIEQQNFGPKVDDLVQLRLTDIRSLVRPRLLDNRLRDADIREPIINAAAQRLDPTAPLGALPQDQAIVAASDPAQRILAIARLQAFRPMTVEEFRMRSGFLVGQIAVNLLIDATDENDPNPFAYDALKTRLNYVRVDDEDNASSADAPDTQTDDTPEG